MLKNAFIKIAFLNQKVLFIRNRHLRGLSAFLVGDFGIVFAVVVKTRNLSPVDIAVFVRFPMEHIWIDAADLKALIVYLASAIFA